MWSAKRGRFCSKSSATALALVGTCLVAAPARAAVYSYVDWTAASVAAGTAEGTITLPDNSTVTVTFAAINENQTPGSLYGAQVDGGVNYWNPSTPYISTEVENAPPTPDILQLEGGLNQTYKVTLSEPIKDPIMAIVSLGQPSVRCTYDFDSPFTIVSQGVGYWGGSTTALKALPDDILEGYEGHGTIQFIGTFSTFSWTVPTPEGWHGFTFGIRTTERLEPTPSEGGAGGAPAGGAGPDTGGSSQQAGGATEGGDSTLPVEGLAGEAAGGALTSSGGGSKSSGGTTSANSGSSADAAGGDGAGGADDGRGVTKTAAGCNCSVPGGGDGSVAVLAVLIFSLRRRRR